MDGTADDLGLPPSLAAAWGAHARPGRGPKRALSLERIVEAAVKIAASEGLQAVSMSRVAAALGASTMSLYRYVAAKDELLALMLDAGTGAPPELPDAADGWRNGLTAWAHAIHHALLSNSWAVHLPISGPPITPNQMAWLERALRCLRDTGLHEAEKMSTALLVSGFVWRQSTLEVDIATAIGADNKWPRIIDNYSATLGRLINPDDFPALTATIASGVFDDPGDDFADEFAFGLNRILDGIGVLIDSRSK
jgi:AcrR family transcriptional regulator